MKAKLYAIDQPHSPSKPSEKNKLSGKEPGNQDTKNKVVSARRVWGANAKDQAWALKV